MKRTMLSTIAHLIGNAVGLLLASILLLYWLYDKLVGIDKLKLG